MDLSEFKNVSADNYLKYTVCDQNVDYDKNIIIASLKNKNNNESFIQRFEVFENIDKTNKMVFSSKVLVYFQICIKLSISSSIFHSRCIAWTCGGFQFHFILSEFGVSNIFECLPHYFRNVDLNTFVEVRAGSLITTAGIFWAAHVQLTHFGYIIQSSGVYG